MESGFLGAGVERGLRFAAQRYAAMMQRPGGAASGWFGPLTFMPGWYEAIARVNPLSAFLDGQRSILQATIDWGHIWYASAFTVALAAITFTLAARAHRNLASRD